MIARMLMCLLVLIMATSAVIAEEDASFLDDAINFAQGAWHDFRAMGDVVLRNPKACWDSAKLSVLSGSVAGAYTACLIGAAEEEIKNIKDTESNYGPAFEAFCANPGDHAHLCMNYWREKELGPNAKYAATDAARHAQNLRLLAYSAITDKALSAILGIPSTPTTEAIGNLDLLISSGTEVLEWARAQETLDQWNNYAPRTGQQEIITPQAADAVSGAGLKPPSPDTVSRSPNVSPSNAGHLGDFLGNVSRSRSEIRTEYSTIESRISAARDRLAGSSIDFEEVRRRLSMQAERFASLGNRVMGSDFGPPNTHSLRAPRFHGESIFDSPRLDFYQSFRTSLENFESARTQISDIDIEKFRKDFLRKYVDSDFKQKFGRYQAEFEAMRSRIQSQQTEWFQNH